MSQLRLNRITVMSAGSPAIQIPNMLGQNIRQNGIIGNQAIQIMQKAGVNVSSATKLITLNQALKAEELKPLATESARLISRSTADIINKAMAIPTGVDAKVSANEIDSALADLTDSVREAHEIIIAQEQTTVTADLASALQNRGYSVQQQIMPTKEVVIKATKDDHVVAAKINGKSEVAMDLAGFDSGECSKEHDAIMADLERLGYRFSVEKKVAHNRRDGGEIVQEINRQFSKIDNHINHINKAKAMNTRRVRR